jgi:hypothetical protein
MNRLRPLLPETDNGRALLLGLVLTSLGLLVMLPPVALWGPGAAMLVPGAIFVFLAFITPPPEGES